MDSKTLHVDGHSFFLSPEVEWDAPEIAAVSKWSLKYKNSTVEEEFVRHVCLKRGHDELFISWVAMFTAFVLLLLVANIDNSFALVMLVPMLLICGASLTAMVWLRLWARKVSDSDIEALTSAAQVREYVHSTFTLGFGVLVFLGSSYYAKLCSFDDDDKVERCYENVWVGPVLACFGPLLHELPRFFIIFWFALSSIPCIIIAHVLFSKTSSVWQIVGICCLNEICIAGLALMKLLSEKEARKRFSKLIECVGSIHQLEERQAGLRSFVDELLPPVLRPKLLATRRAADLSDMATCTVFGVVEFERVTLEVLPTTAVGIVVSLNAILSEQALKEQDQVVRIGTLGDHFIAASNLITMVEDHAAVTVRFALKAMDVVAQRKAKEPFRYPPAFRLSCGIHSGGLCGAVISLSHIRYDIFGDAYATARVLQSVARPDEIVVSESCVSQIADRSSLHFAPLAQGSLDCGAYSVTESKGGGNWPLQQQLAPSQLAAMSSDLDDGLISLQINLEATVPAVVETEQEEQEEEKEEVPEKQQQQPSPPLPRPVSSRSAPIEQKDAAGPTTISASKEEELVPDFTTTAALVTMTATITASSLEEREAKEQPSAQGGHRSGILAHTLAPSALSVLRKAATIAAVEGCNSAMGGGGSSTGSGDHHHHHHHQSHKKTQPQREHEEAAARKSSVNDTPSVSTVGGGAPVDDNTTTSNSVTTSHWVQKAATRAEKFPSAVFCIVMCVLTLAIAVVGCIETRVHTWQQVGGLSCSAAAFVMFLIASITFFYSVPIPFMLYQGLVLVAPAVLVVGVFGLQPSVATNDPSYVLVMCCVLLLYSLLQTAWAAGIAVASLIAIFIVLSFSFSFLDAVRWVAVTAFFVIAGFKIVWRPRYLHSQWDLEAALDQTAAELEAMEDLRVAALRMVLPQPILAWINKKRHSGSRKGFFGFSHEEAVAVMFRFDDVMRQVVEEKSFECVVATVGVLEDLLTDKTELYLASGIGDHLVVLGAISTEKMMPVEQDRILAEAMFQVLVLIDELKQELSSSSTDNSSMATTSPLSSFSSVPSLRRRPQRTFTCVAIEETVMSAVSAGLFPTYHALGPALNMGTALLAAAPPGAAMLTSRFLSKVYAFARERKILSVEGLEVGAAETWRLRWSGSMRVHLFKRFRTPQQEQFEGKVGGSSGHSSGRRHFGKLHGRLPQRKKLSVIADGN